MAAKVENLRHNWLRVVAGRPGGNSDMSPEMRRALGERVADMREHAGGLRPGQREEIVEYYLNTPIPHVEADTGDFLRMIEKLINRPKYINADSR